MWNPNDVKKLLNFFFQSVTPPNIASRKFYLSARKFSDQRETSWPKIFNGLSFVRKWRCLVDFLKSKYTSIVKVQSKDDRCSIYPLSNVKNYGLIKLLSDSINNFVWVKSRFENLFYTRNQTARSDLSLFRLTFSLFLLSGNRTYFTSRRRKNDTNSDLIRRSRRPAEIAGCARCGDCDFRRSQRSAYKIANIWHVTY